MAWMTVPGNAVAWTARGTAANSWSDIADADTTWYPGAGPGTLPSGVLRLTSSGDVRVTSNGDSRRVS